MKVRKPPDLCPELEISRGRVGCCACIGASWLASGLGMSQTCQDRIDNDTAPLDGVPTHQREDVAHTLTGHKAQGV
jgi:hypothetical protein